MGGIEFSELEDSNKWFSQAISSGVRTTAFGTIAAVWAILTADGLSLTESSALGVSTAKIVAWVFTAASLTLVTDILQYAAGYWMTSIGIERWDKKKQEKKGVVFFYDRKNLGKFGNFLYRANLLLLPTKIILATVAGALLVALSFSITFA